MQGLHNPFAQRRSWTPRVKSLDDGTYGYDSGETNIDYNVYVVVEAGLAPDVPYIEKFWDCNDLWDAYEFLNIKSDMERWIEKHRPKETKELLK